MQITFIADAHGKFTELNHKIERHIQHNRVVQCGDMGLGFKWNDLSRKFPKNFYFIRGNHDNPETCRTFSNYLGDFGYNKELNLFFIGGAWSIDQNLRKEGVSWWRDEELNWEQCQQCVELYNQIKPDYVISHDCPQEIGDIILNKLLIGSMEARHKTKTSQLLSQLFQDHKPKFWIFGHWHLDFDMEILGTRFICQKELGEKTFDL